MPGSTITVLPIPETATFLDEQARVIRQFASADQYITSNYIPTYDVGYVGMSKELDFVAYTRYMVYGGDRGIGPKGYRVGEYSRIAMANDYFRPLKGLLRGDGASARAG